MDSPRKLCQLVEQKNLYIKKKTEVPVVQKDRKKDGVTDDEETTKKKRLKGVGDS